MPAERPVHLVLDSRATQLIRTRALHGARAVEVDGGDVLRVGDEPGSDVLFAYLEPGERPDAALSRVDHGFDTRALCTVDGTDIRCFDPEHKPLDVTAIPERADVFDRVRGVFETDVLRDRSVAVLGLGSGGSVILRELVRCGVGRFLLVDHDRLETGNVCRHECGLSDVGRLKTNAARDLVFDRNPDAEVVTLDLRIDSDTIDELTVAIRAANVDLVMCATDNRESRLIVNRICVLAKLPALFAGVFRRAYGGQVLRYLPDLAPCYQCFVSALPTMAGDHEVSNAEQATRISYSDRPVAVEPGLSGDIAPIALLVAKLAIQELLSGTPTTLDSLDEDLVAPLYLWLNRREAGTDYAAWRPMATGVDEMSVLRWYGIGLARNESCAVCGNMTVEGVEPDAELDLSIFQAG